MPSYQNFVSTRTTTPDGMGMLTALRTAIATDLGVNMVDFQHYTLKKGSVWTPSEITAAQNILDTFAPFTAQLAAQHSIDNMDIQTKAFMLYLLDRLNIIHAALPTPIPQLTPAQALAGMRAKAGTL